MSAANQSALVLSFHDARRTVEEHARPLKGGQPETLPLLESLGRVLAEPISADRDFPPFPRATRDGFAVRAADVATVPAKLKVVSEIRAGYASNRPVGSGECAEIMTGAPAPQGADAVVMVEYTARAGEHVDIQRSVRAGENIVPAGAEGKQGAELVARGARMSYSQVAIAAAVGKSRVNVFRRPRIAILSTGDEIVDVAQTPGPNQIRNSNSYSLAAQVALAGGEPLQLPVAPDEKGRLRELVEQGLRSDLLLMTGGVSMGKYDLVEQVLSELGAEFFFTGAQIQPGRPVVFGRAAASDRPTGYFFGLPGNPISTMVTFDLFARPLLDALAGAPVLPLRFLQARLKTEFKTKTGLTRFLPAVLSGADPAQVEPVRWQGSGDIAANGRADCYLVVPPDRERLAAGDMVGVLLR